MSGSTLAEGLQLMVKILRLSDENPQDHMAILVLCSQVGATVHVHVCIINTVHVHVL